MSPTIRACVTCYFQTRLTEGLKLQRFVLQSKKMIGTEYCSVAEGDRFAKDKSSSPREMNLRNYEATQKSFLTFARKN